MKDENDSSNSASSETTLPAKLKIALSAFDTEDHANKVGGALLTVLNVIGTYIDLKNLDGVTVSYAYKEALLSLDRGYKTSHQLTPSEGVAIGIAMTPLVLRDGKVKSHIVLDAKIISSLPDHQSELFALALHTVAHECAHVEINDKFDDSFPGTLLQQKHDNAHDSFRWQVILASWDEYAATFISAPFGEDPTSGYEETFISVVSQARLNADKKILEYRLHRDVSRALAEIYGIYGDLMKFSCYHLGNVAGRNKSIDDFPLTKKAIHNHWFEPYFGRLNKSCAGIMENYGKWEDKSSFESLGDLLDEIVESGGLYVTHLGNGELYVHIP